MDISKQPFVTRRQLWLLFAVAVFTTHVWGIINILREYPAWVLRMNLWEMIGTISVAMLYSLLDALLPLMGILLLAFILPRRFFRAKLIPWGAALVLIGSIWMAVFHLNPDWFAQRNFFILSVWALTFLAAMAGAYWLIYRWPAVEKGMRSFVERLTTLSVLYIFIDFVSIIVIVIRNI